MLSISYIGFTQDVFILYPGDVPNSKYSFNKETIAYNSDSSVSIINNVTVPSLTVYLPQIRNQVRAAVIICPGGGYSYLAFKPRFCSRKKQHFYILA